MARDVDGLTFDGFTALKAGGPTLALEAITNLIIQGSLPLADASGAAVDMMTY
jgi:hypothetical protein